VNTRNNEEPLGIGLLRPCPIDVRASLAVNTGDRVPQRPFVGTQPARWPFRRYELPLTRPDALDSSRHALDPHRNALDSTERMLDARSDALESSSELTNAELRAGRLASRARRGRFRSHRPNQLRPFLAVEPSSTSVGRSSTNGQSRRRQRRGRPAIHSAVKERSPDALDSPETALDFS
jgi:hypothetical protein